MADTQDRLRVLRNKLHVDLEAGRMLRLSPDGIRLITITGRRTCDIVPQLKRSLPKLVVRRETIRALVTLELAQAGGGDMALAPSDTCKEMCTLPAIAKPPVAG